jgi:hypothetical protein
MKKFASVVLLIVSVQCFAADWTLTTNGTRVTCSPGSGDWNDPAENFANLDAVMNTCAGSLSAGDTITMDAGTYTRSSFTCGGGINVTGEITIQSRSGNPTDVVIAGSNPTGAAISFGCANGNNDFRFKDVTISKTATHTAVALAVVYIYNETRNVIFDNVIIGNFDVNVPANNSSLSGVVFSRFNGTRTSRKLTFKDSVFQHMNVAYENAAPYLVNASAGTDVDFEGDNVIGAINVTSLGSGSTDGSNGGVHMIDGALRILGNVLVVDVDMVMNPTDRQRAVFNVEHPSTVYQSPDSVVTCRDVTMMNSDTGGVCFRVTGAFDLRGWIEGERAISQESVGSNNNGAIVLFATSDAQGRAKVRCRDSVSKNGAALYFGDGAGGVFYVDSIGCRSTTGVVYSGGDGDGRVMGIVTKSGPRDGETPISGLEFYSHINSSTSTRDKTTNISGLVIGPRQYPADVPAVFISNNDPTYDHTVNLYNTIIFPSHPVGVLADEAPTATLNINGRSNDVYQSSIDVTDIVNGTVDITGTFNVAPGFIGGYNPSEAGGFVLRADSVLRGAGVCYLSPGCSFPGLDGYSPTVPPNIGAYMR